MPKQNLTKVPRVPWLSLEQVHCPEGDHHPFTLQAVNEASLPSLHRAEPTISWQMRCQECKRITALIERKHINKIDSKND